jgi:effector-binding domain-containing protein
MSITTRVIDAVPQPMVYVTTRTSMQPHDIRAAMEKSFAILGRFLRRADAMPLAPPLAVYRDWNGRLVTVDVGFPVSEADAAKAKGTVKAGHTPAGPAIKTVHWGSYDKLKDTYDELAKAMNAQGYAAGDATWEVYFGEPGKTPDKDLITEIYMQLAEPEAARAAG